MKSLKATAERERSMFGKLGKTYTARLSDTGWQVTGATDKETALDALHETLKRAAEYTQTRKYVRKGSVTFCLYYAQGWQYDIVRDDGADGHYGSCCLTCRTYTEALDRMLSHVAQHDGI